MAETSETQSIEDLRALLPVDAAALAGLTDAALVQLLRSAETLGAVVDGARTLLAGEVSVRSHPGSDGLNGRLGCRTAGEVIERATGVSAQTARSRMRAAGPLRAEWSLCGEMLPGAFPLVRRAVEDGAVSLDAAAAITGVLAPLRERGCDAAGLATAERELVAAATGTTHHAAAAAGEAQDGAAGAEPAPAASADEVRIMSHAWALFLDPDGTLDEAGTAERRREFTVGRVRDGLVRVGGALLPEVAAQLERLLDAYLNPKVAAGVHFAENPDLVADSDNRSPAQRRHDALAGVLGVAASHADTPQLGGAAPVLVVTATPDQLEDPHGVAFVATGDGDHAVPASVARHSGCAGAVQRILRDAEGRILQLGSPQRIFTPHQRRAIANRDGECVIPGCHVPASWCEVHHVTEHARGGPTHTDNGVLLCWHHHRTIESGGWQIDVRNGTPWVRPPGWIDAHRTWRPALGTTRHRYDRLRT